MDHDLARFLGLMESAVCRAAHRILDITTAPNAIQAWRKADDSMVTSMDLESQKTIHAELGSEITVVSEEEPESHSAILRESRYFLVDPLDGTTSCRRFLGEAGGQLGYGPLVGLVLGGKLQACAFVNLPRRAIFSAVRGIGSFQCDLLEGALPPLELRRRLNPEINTSFENSALLFYPGARGELEFVQHLKKSTQLENVYRFGGFANDMTRLACGYEQAQLQYAVKAWDYAAVLLAIEAGYEAVFDPQGERRRFSEWKIAVDNPVLVSLPGILGELLNHLDFVNQS